MQNNAPASPASNELHGSLLWLAAFVIAGANFMAVLDMTIANVSVSTISGNLGATISQGTWVITSYSVAEAITVPLTGWLAGRFGTVRVFITAMVMFGLCSAMCGFAPSFGFLVAARICQGLAGGPLMPLAQTLLLRIFPREKAGAANGIWAMTTLIAPILGPILGGYICEDYSWGWIFIINVPVAAAAAFMCYRLIRRYETPKAKHPIDKIGLALLIVWVSCLQLVLDEGKDLDWYSSKIIWGLTLVAIIGFITFLIWEFYEDKPIVDIHVFRHRGFTISVIAICLGFGAMFASNVLTPLWLQNYMGYTSFLSGKTTSWSGVLAVCVAPVVAGLVRKIDPRQIVFVGLSWLFIITLWRCSLTTDADHNTILWPILLMGIGMPMFFVPLSALALSSLNEHEIASGAGLMNFARTLSGAFATSLITTQWQDESTLHHADLVGITDLQGYQNTLSAVNIPNDISMNMLDQLLNAQSIMLSTNELMLVISFVYLLAACIVWLAPRPNFNPAALTASH